MADCAEVSITREELLTAQRMLKVVDEQLVILKRRAERKNADWRLAPTDKQLFFYSSDSRGIMQFQSDSSFVAEQIFVYGMPFGSEEFMSIEDMASGRALTQAQEPIFTDATDTTSKVDGIWIPPSAWAPTLPGSYFGSDSLTADSALWNFDHVATLETDFVVARSGALRFRFRHSADGYFRPGGGPGGVPNTGIPQAVQPALNYTVTLVGYKVY